MRKLFGPVLYICGILTLIMAAMMLAPTIFAFIYHDPEAHDFLFSAMLTILLGASLVWFFRVPQIALSARQLYLLTSSSWLVLSLTGAFPFIFSHHPMSITNAIFESVSGITTTGSTVMSDLKNVPHAILLWRSLLQWLGGLGVIGMAVSVLPFLRIGGMRLFQTESSDWSEKTMPRFQQFAKAVLTIYIAITFLCSLCYWLAGMTVFDAINHAMTTVSTGGYATDDLSMARFDSKILLISVIFMLLSAMPFMLYVRILIQRSMKKFLDQQVETFLAIIILATLILAGHLIASKHLPVMDAITHSAFNIVSMITTTGYASADYTLWGHFSIALFFLATFVGGCSGSTTGGMKIFRFQLSYLYLRDQLRKLVHPRGVFAIRYNGKVVENDIIASAAAFSFMFFVSLGAVTLLLTALGLDFLTSITAAVTALANVGPGLGEIIGPSGNFEPLPDIAKWILAVAMILGRLELFTVIILFSPVFWRG
ncbi:MAG: TrkH family potassium uptake protein [Pseudomonadales bacterium]|nr:TrkH family potassium uptake protein [Pseudomonadales bacterium]MCP5216278.1 TrkH family potassium uptake protein [Pseudomonadales bacterium]